MFKIRLLSIEIYWELEKSNRFDTDNDLIFDMFI